MTPAKSFRTIRSYWDTGLWLTTKIDIFSCGRLGLMRIYYRCTVISWTRRKESVISLEKTVCWCSTSFTHIYQKFIMNELQWLFKLLVSHEPSKTQFASRTTLDIFASLQARSGKPCQNETLKSIFYSRFQLLKETCWIIPAFFNLLNITSRSYVYYVWSNIHITVHMRVKRTERQVIPGERLLAEFQLLQQMRQQLMHRLISDATFHDVCRLVRPGHDSNPRLVDIRESLRLLQYRSALRDCTRGENHFFMSH